jgi:hypothetical protein
MLLVGRLDHEVVDLSAGLAQLLDERKLVSNLHHCVLRIGDNENPGRTVLCDGGDVGG